MTRTAQIFSLAKPFWVRSNSAPSGLAHSLARCCSWWSPAPPSTPGTRNSTRTFSDALQNRDTAGFNHSLLLIFTTIIFIVAVAVAKRYLEQALEIRWRWSLTHDMMGRWFKDRAFYRIERDNRLDNPTSA